MNMDRDRETDINFDFLRGVIMGAAGCILVLLSALTIAHIVVVYKQILP